MPARRSRAGRRALVAGVLGVVVAVVVFGAVLALSQGDDVQIRLGDDEFRVGDVERLAAEVDDRGPFLVPDASPNRSRDIYVQHLAPDVEEGWRAFAARPEGTARECSLEWAPDDGEFVDPCSGNRFPADGRGLTRYAVRIEDGVLFVDLNDSRAP